MALPPWAYSPPSTSFRGDPERDGRPLDGRPCALGEHCASAVTADGPDGPERIPLRGPRAFCDPDRGKAATALDALPRDYAALAGDLRNPGQGTTAVRSPFGPRIPFGLGTEALMRAITESLASWHDRVAGVASLAELPDRDGEGRRIVRDGWLVDRAVKVLSPRLDALLALEPEPVRRAAAHHLIAMLGDAAPDGTVRSGYAAMRPELGGADAGLEILWLHRMARAALGETRPRPVELLGVPCPECDMLALRRADLPDDPGQDPPWSVCAECGDVMTEAGYRDWTRRYARWADGRQPETLA